MSAYGDRRCQNSELTMKIAGATVLGNVLIPAGLKEVGDVTVCLLDLAPIKRLGQMLRIDEVIERLRIERLPF